MKTSILKALPTILLFVLTSNYSFAGQIEIAKDLELLYHNKKKTGFLNIGNKIEITETKQQLVLRYYKRFTRSGQHNEVQSQPIIIEFEADIKGNYKLQVPKIHQARKAEQFAKQPKIELYDDKGPLAFVMHLLEPHSGFSFNRDILAELKQWEAAKNNQANSKLKKVKSEESKLTEEDADTALEMLKFWYQKAKPSSQQEFKQWLAEQ